MSGLQIVNAGYPKVASPADDLLSSKSRRFVHPDDVVDDQALTVGDKRSLLAAWASDALAVEDSPSLRQLPSGAVVCVNEVLAALKSLDGDESGRDVSAAFCRSFARRRIKPVVRRRGPRPDDDNDPPPFAAGAAIPMVRKRLIGVQRGAPHLQVLGSR